ncbi:MAG: hypothetical protein RIA69_05735 [Cyclobacteriaceae bacterium]
MAEKEYTLVNHLHKKYLFTSIGFNDEVPYSDMRVFRFFNDTFSFHIFAIMEDYTLVFGDDISFYNWLIKKGVEAEEHEIFNFAVVEPISKMHKLVCSTKDDLLVNISISSLNFDGAGSITTKEKEPKLLFQFEFGDNDALPVLKNLERENPKILWHVTGKDDELPSEVKKYYEELAEIEKGNEISGIITIMVVIAVIAYIIYSIFAE